MQVPNRRPLVAFIRTTYGTAILLLVHIPAFDVWGSVALQGGAGAIGRYSALLGQHMNPLLTTDHVRLAVGNADGNAGYMGRIGEALVSSTFGRGAPKVLPPRVGVPHASVGVRPTFATKGTMLRDVDNVSVEWYISW